MKIIGLDVGEKRIGVAKVDSDTRIAVPVGFINVDGLEYQEIAQVARMNNTNIFVIGLPRSNEGNETQQSLYVRNFAKVLVEQIPDAKVRFQDESLTSVVAEERLKSRKKKYEKGDIDAEAASIILQDFVENLGANATPGNLSVEDLSRPTGSEGAPEPRNDGREGSVSETKALQELQNVKDLARKQSDKVLLNTKKVRHKMKTSTKILSSGIAIIVILGLIAIGGFLWAQSMLSPVMSDCGTACEEVQFVVADGESKTIIADNLEQSGLIKNSFVFKTYMQLFKPDVNLKSGIYMLNKGLTADDIIDKLAKGADDENTFMFTILPGENIYSIKQKLLKLNYSSSEIDAAFSANYDYEFLNERPSGATLEGYLYGETHEFFKDATVKDILDKYLAGMAEVISENGLRAKYKAQGLSLFEGITLASIVQKEAHSPDQPTVAQVFLSRLSMGIPLGSDVTVSYALDTIDPDRQTYQDNQAALTVDSCYNTRVRAGLPCGPISNPGLSALLAVANPSDTSYLYFLTGDDGLMYYSYTETEHNQNIYSHCQELCNVSL